MNNKQSASKDLDKGEKFLDKQLIFKLSNPMQEIFIKVKTNPYKSIRYNEGIATRKFMKMHTKLKWKKAESYGFHFCETINDKECYYIYKYIIYV